MKNRIIVYIPTIHQCFEERDTLEKVYDKKKVSQYFLEANEFWKTVEVYVNKINLKIDRIFLEGWTGNEKELSEARKDLGEMADKLNDDDLLQTLFEVFGEKHKESTIVLELIKKGAILEETESRELLDKMSKIWENTKNMGLNWKENPTIVFEKGIKNVENGSVICKQRDIYIAKQINDNLLTGETGILFIGKSHNVLLYLSKDIKIITDKNISDMGGKISSNFLKPFSK